MNSPETLLNTVDSPTNLSAQSKSSPKPRSKTVPYRSGFVYERAIPSGRSPIHIVVSSEWRIKVSLSVRGWLMDAGIAGTTQSEDIGARLASASKYLAPTTTVGYCWDGNARREELPEVMGTEVLKSWHLRHPKTSSIWPITAFSS